MARKNPGERLVAVVDGSESEVGHRRLGTFAVLRRTLAPLPAHVLAGRLADERAENPVEMEMRECSYRGHPL